MIRAVNVGGRDVEFGDLKEIRRLVKYQHLIGAIVSLDGRALRYGELGSAITTWAGTRIGDGEVTRTVNRLAETGLARKTYVDGHYLISLTQAGRCQLKTIYALGRALRSGHLDTTEAGHRDVED